MGVGSRAGYGTRMAEIEVTATGAEEFQVVVREGGGSTTHTVSASPDDVARYGGEDDPAALVERSFRFLLAREPKEAILGRFALPVIERYFPEYGAEIRRG